MRRDVVALLFVPPWEPIRLRTDRAVVIGRSPSCDLPIPSANVSRKHAWVCWEGSGYVVQDLGSTNGTYVNEQRVLGTRPMQSGDRVRVGEHTIVFCVADEALAQLQVSPNDSATQVFTREQLEGEVSSETTEALRGDLSQIPAFAVLQLLEIGCKTGRLDLLTSRGTSVVWFERGRPVHARSGTDYGVEAFIRLSHAERGHFHFEPLDKAPQVTIELSMAELLLEASRRHDEAVRG